MRKILSREGEISSFIYHLAMEQRSTSTIVSEEREEITCDLLFPAASLCFTSWDMWPVGRS